MHGSRPFKIPYIRDDGGARHADDDDDDDDDGGFVSIGVSVLVALCEVPASFGIGHSWAMSPRARYLRDSSWVLHGRQASENH